MSDLQQRIAEKIDGVIGDDCEHYGLEEDPNTPGGCKTCHEYAKRIAERLMPVVREAQAQTLRDTADTLLPKGILWWGDSGVRVSNGPFDMPHGSLDDWLRARADQVEGK